MAKYTVTGTITVSCYTEVEADNAKAALEIAEYRDVATLCHQPFCGDVDEEWIFDSDGTPAEIEVME